MLTRKPPQRPSREDRLAALMSSTVQPVQRAVMATPASVAARAAAPAPAKLPRQVRTMQALRDSAQGMPCRMRLVGCPCDPAMTIWSHCRHQYADKGASIKAVDLLGADACTYCDAVYDGQRPRPAGLTAEDVELAWWRAHAESIVDRARRGFF